MVKKESMSKHVMKAMDKPNRKCGSHLIRSPRLAELMVIGEILHLFVRLPTNRFPARGGFNSNPIVYVRVAST